ncbi:MAG: neutral/alkaline non-lysosomal ceramidase N-terminal domain-containing protein [Planctomycetes bacterium]|nr:neutral/alkaline non-lysosomal ceramidase N-terminal domain-containing protein [Planctomycetota bacterium]
MYVRALFLGFVLLVCIGAPALAQEKQTTWQAGAAKVVITPREFMWMSGYGGRNKPADGKVHDLWAKALVLQDPQGNRCVLVTMDLVGIDRTLSDDVCATIKKKHGFERSNIMLSVSHTHCGPVVGRNLLTMYNLDEKQLGLVKSYTQDLHDKLVELVGVADKNARPANISWATGRTTFATNRRENVEKNVPDLRELGKLKGPVDHDVPVLCVRDLEGKVKSIVFGYACHATVMDFYKWSGDYPGFAQLELEKRYPDATALFFAGCGADQNPLPRRKNELAEAYGKQLAQAVDQVIKAPMATARPTLRTTYTTVDIPFGELPTREKLVLDTMSKDRFIAARAKTLLAEFEKAGSLKKIYPYPVQAWRLGDDLTWIALGGEVVVDYSLRLKKELAVSPSPPGRGVRGEGIWVTGYANDVMAYIPSLKVLKEGRYEGDTSMIYYGMPCAWGPRVEGLIVETVHGQVARVRK